MSFSALWRRPTFNRVTPLPLWEVLVAGNTFYWAGSYLKLWYSDRPTRL
jgi:hypothetical protein